MYTIESKFTEMVQIAKEKGINTKGMNKAQLINELNALEPAVVEIPKQKGRPINPDSPRQLRLAEQAARKENGGTIGRGRPANPESAWFKRQAELATKREAGELKLGRAVNPNSARQQRLALKGKLPLGRPKAIKTEITEAAHA